MPSSMHDTSTAQKGAKCLRLLLLSVGNKSSFRVAEGASVSRGPVRSTTYKQAPMLCPQVRCLTPCLPPRFHFFVASPSALPQMRQATKVPLRAGVFLQGRCTQRLKKACWVIKLPCYKSLSYILGQVRVYLPTQSHIHKHSR